MGFKLGPVMMALTVVVLVSVLSLFFLVQVFQSSTTGYEVSDLQTQVEDLKEENKKLELQAAELKSLQGVEESVVEMNMVDVDRIVYVEQVDYSTFAAK